MPLFSQIFSWLAHSGQDDELRLWLRRQPLPPVTFAKFLSVDKPPQMDDVRENTFYYVSPMNHPKWALFKCPCGCNYVITLSLQRAHRPHWNIDTNQNNRPNLYPSVWRDADCMSHFWIQDGRVYWCQDSGTSPFMRYYSS